MKVISAGRAIGAGPAGRRPDFIKFLFLRYFHITSSSCYSCGANPVKLGSFIEPIYEYVCGILDFLVIIENFDYWHCEVKVKISKYQVGEQKFDQFLKPE